MGKPHVFVTRRIFEPQLARVRDACDAEIWPDHHPPLRATLLDCASRADGLLTMVTDRIDAELLDAAPRLRVVSNLAAGYDNIDIPAATARGVAIGNTPGILADATAELAFTLMLVVARRIVEGVRYIERGEWTTWAPLVLLGHGVTGATVGIVGLGRIGQAFAERCRAFNMRILYTGRTRRHDAEARLGATHCDLDTLLRQADFVSLHTPLTAATRHLIDRRRLAAMQPHAILVNTARGAVVDHAALYDALKQGTIAGAGLDVTDPEPLPPDHPLFSLPNCVIVPHIGSATIATRERMAALCVDNLLAGVSGRPLPHAVNPEVTPRAPTRDD